MTGNGRDFGQSVGAHGVIAFSRILSDREVIVVANTNGSNGFTGKVLVDIDLSRTNRTTNIVYSNKGSNGSKTTGIAPGNIYSFGQSPVATQIASLPVTLAAWEVQILAPQ